MSAKTNSPICIGMIVPPAAGLVPPEPLELFPDVQFIASGLGLTTLSPDGYDSVIDQIADHAKQLAKRGADIISLMGTSLSFYRGPQFNTQLISVMSEASGRPATTMTDSIIDALMQFNSKTIAVATAYNDSVNEPLRRYLTDKGFEIQHLNSLDIQNVDEIFNVNKHDLMNLGRDTIARAPQADALLISCGGLNTASITEPLEKQCMLPVVSSAMAGTWGAMRLAGLDYRVPGYGQLFAE